MIYGIEYENSGWGNEDELDRAAWDAKHDFPLRGHQALLYSDEQRECLVAAYVHGQSEDEMLSLLIDHLATCERCNPAAVRCERKAA
jgi:hypothetical protein